MNDNMEWYCTGCKARFDTPMVTTGPKMCPRCFVFDIMQVKKQKRAGEA